MRARALARSAVLAAALAAIAAGSAAVADPAEGGVPRGPPPDPPSGSAPAGAVERRREAIARELVREGARLQAEIERGDVAALLARVPESGLRCGGRVVPKARVARDLAAPASWLHGAFFGAPGEPAGAARPRSLAALFRSGREIAVVVSFRRDPRAGAAGRPCLDFRAKGVATPGAPLCFEARGGRWWFTESLYPCG